MPNISCLRCKEAIDSTLEQCPACGEKVTSFQRTYASRLIDGKYQILDRLGIGGMGEIFKVRHIHLNELRVIKIMRPNVAADDQGLQRFLQEARTSTMIKHKNLAMLYDFSQLDDGSYYMVWEFIDGTNIQKWMAQHGPVPARLAVEIAVQALNGLEHLHAMGLIHRDISPENIMLSQDHQGKLLVKVIDFGIAKQLAEGEGNQGLTQTGMFLGKLKYASPEQAGFLKDGEHLDARSDIYSFGIVMYEMLAGKAPFQATNPHGYILKHVTERPAAIADQNPDVNTPPTLEALIFQSLEKNRDQRFASAADFAAALEAIRADIPPDTKYGVGERMITLSGAQTLSDLRTSGGSFGAIGTTPGTTAPGSPVRTAPAPSRGAGGGPTGTRAASEEATRMERQQAPPQPKSIGSDEATVMERLSGPGAAATVMEPKGAWGSPAEGEATVMERQVGSQGPAKKSNAGLISAIAAVLVIILAGGIWFVTHKPAPATTVNPTTAAISSAAVTATGATSTMVTSTNPIPVGQGALLLSATPWGDLDKIINKANQQPVDITDEKRSTPTRIDLPPGDYAVTVKDPTGQKPVTLNVTIAAGQKTPTLADFGVDMNELEKDIHP